MQTSVKALPILNVLFRVQTKYNKLYCFPSQQKILRLMREYLDDGKSIATLNRWLRRVEDAGYIKRQRRIIRHKVKGLLFQSTMYKITHKGLLLLARYNSMVWAFINRLIKSPRGESKKPSLDPDKAFSTSGGKGWKAYLAAGGKSPSLKK